MFSGDIFKFRCVIYFFKLHVLEAVGFSMLAKDGPTVD